MTRLRLFICALLFTTGLATSVSAQSLPQTVLRPGDVLRVVVWRNEEMSGEFNILADGSLSHPLYREVRVTDIPLSAVNDSLRSFLSRFEAEPSFVIEPLYRIAVGGEVRQPSVYPLAPFTTLAEAVAAAGGPTERGRIDRVRLQRGGAEIQMDLLDPSPGAMANTPIQSGDRLFVERRASVWRDYIVPASSLLAAAAALTNIIINR